MSLGLDDVHRIAELAHIDIDDEQAHRMQAELNDIFKMIERIQAVDTDGVEPMMHPHDGVQRQREDAVVFGNDREENMKNAPEEYEGMFLVPQVIEEQRRLAAHTPPRAFPGTLKTMADNTFYTVVELSRALAAREVSAE